MQNNQNKEERSKISVANIKTNGFKPKSILVTGGAGFIGANFLHYLGSQDLIDAKVVNLDLITYAANTDFLSDLKLADYKLVKGSIVDSKLVEQLFIDHQFDCVIHFAAESHVDRSISGPMQFIETNVLGTAVLLEAARKNWASKIENEVRFHHISTDEVFGSLKLEDPAFCETTPYDPSSPYSSSKASSDHLVRAWNRTYGLPVTISNCSNNYGQGQNDEKLIPTVIRNALLGNEIPVYGDGTNRRDWLYVIDHCEAIWQIVQFGEIGQTYAIGGGVELSNNQVVAIICETLDKKRTQFAPHSNLVKFITDRAGHDWRYAINAQKMTDKLGWQAKFKFEQAIDKTIDYYLDYYGK